MSTSATALQPFFWARPPYSGATRPPPAVSVRQKQQEVDHQALEHQCAHCRRTHPEWRVKHAAVAFLETLSFCCDLVCFCSQGCWGHGGVLASWCGHRDSGAQLRPCGHCAAGGESEPGGGGDAPGAAHRSKPQSPMGLMVPSERLL